MVPNQAGDTRPHASFPCLATSPTMLLTQLNTPLNTHSRHVQPVAAHGAPSVSSRGQQKQMRGSSTSSFARQPVPAQRAAVVSAQGWRRHSVVVPAAVGNGNGKPAADEGEADTLQGELGMCSDAAWPRMHELETTRQVEAIQPHTPWLGRSRMLCMPELCWCLAGRASLAG